jgi:hypothetical protein
MGINRRDWRGEYITVEIPDALYNRMAMPLSVAKQVTEKFLSWYYDWLLEHEPKATCSHAEINNILGLIQGDLNEVLRTK